MRRSVSSRLAWSGLAASSVAAARLRKRFKLPPAVTTAWVFAAAPSIARAFDRSRARDGSMWLAHMWAYKVAFELPNDRPEHLRDRAHIDYPLALDRWLGGGKPPSQRLQ